MPRADGMENTVDEGDAEQLPDRSPILLGCPDEARQRTVEGGLFGKNPASEPRGGHAGRGMGRAKWRAPCRDNIGHTGDEDRRQCDRGDSTRSGHWHFTRILLAKVSP